MIECYNKGDREKYVSSQDLSQGWKSHFELTIQTVLTITVRHQSKISDRIREKRSWSCAKSSCNLDSVHTTRGASSHMDLTNSERTTKLTSDTRPKSVAPFSSRDIVIMETDATFYTSPNLNPIQLPLLRTLPNSKTSESTSLKSLLNITPNPD